ncbi:hypothetical protein HYPSUDRAFT_203338 [Hypholoma sublateritium FD-334 SS-4]|uniref:Uncharacterized protein n=1 Tax=Hypholoma sublateritium (strain FD-334 SS-4) TaxID=945553 RepID=A0A0D2PM23_HYPSF|nr:hypothetical protein HYPSUDRAFT_203338 [Hypholoma sublateritium FD-334 SS-4]
MPAVLHRARIRLYPAPCMRTDHAAQRRSFGCTVSARKAVSPCPALCASLSQLFDARTASTASASSARRSTFSPWASLYRRGERTRCAVSVHLPASGTRRGGACSGGRCISTRRGVRFPGRPSRRLCGAQREKEGRAPSALEIGWTRERIFLCWSAEGRWIPMRRAPPWTHARAGRSAAVRSITMRYALSYLDAPPPPCSVARTKNHAPLAMRFLWTHVLSRDHIDDFSGADDPAGSSVLSWDDVRDGTKWGNALFTYWTIRSDTVR